MTMRLSLFALLAMFVFITAAQDPPKLHTALTSAERLHYFGTELIEEVPHYEYTTPRRIDRKKRSTEDENLEYIIEAFGQTTHLVLERNTDLISPGCIVQHHKGNGSHEVYPCATDEINCFYTGRSSNHSNSWVAASVCGGMNAVVGLPDKTLVVQAVKETHRSRAKRDTTLADPHIVYQYKQHKRSCSDSADDEVQTDQPRRRRSSNNILRSETLRRRRRNAGKKYVETTVVVDPTSYRFHGSETENMVKTVMNVAAQRFLDPSLESELYFTLNKIKILEHDEAGLTIEEDSGVTLNSFCHWQAGWNPTEDSNPEHADYIVLITKVNLEHNGNKDNTGLARKGMCGSRTRCSVNEDTGLGTGLIIAHETGHVLGMSHDSEGNNCANSKNIMASMAPSGPDSLKWSSCSANALKTFLSSSESSCLDDAPPAGAEKLYESTTKPGSIYTADHQCKLMLGPHAEICEGVHGTNIDVCGGIVCRPKHDTGVNGCVIYATPLMDGTDCGNRMWCMNARCVAMGPGSPNPVNGGWSSWESDYSQCSRSCGGGVKVKRRFCNNPEPMYGGRHCSGPSAQAELCNLQECSISQHEFLAQQCAATDNNPIQDRKYHWIPNPDVIGDDSCKINCQADGTNYFAKRGISVDGSECSSEQSAPFIKCVKGNCKTFGCDGHMDSGHVYDKCGICNGKGNTCKKLSGTFHEGKAKVFTTFVTIPKGSTGITITQGNMYCYLSLTVNGERLFTESTPHLSGTYTRGGVIIKYQSKPERIEIVGPINNPVQAQVYRQYDPPYVGVDPDVYYEYHVATSTQTTTYLWKTKAGACSKSCGTGEQSPVITCESSVSGTVDDYNCNLHEKPSENIQQCNTHACPPRWRGTQWSQCSRSCGGGQKTRTVECVEENNNVEKVLLDSRCHGQTKPSTSTTCNEEPCPGVWKPGAWSACSETCAQGLKTRTVSCYSSASSTTVVPDSNCLAGDKPDTQKYCVVKPCRTDISGAACTDKVDDCFGSYGDAVCTGDYKSWARSNCMKSCGVCADNPSDFDENCKDAVDNCNQYTSGFCTSSAYQAWAKNNCKKFCGYCEGAVATTQAPALSGDCLDTDNCAGYGTSVCTEYASWAKTHCKKFCNLCELSQNAESSVTSNICEDSADCEAYGTSVCSMQEFTHKHCRRYCGLCQAGCTDKQDNCAAYGSSMCTEYKPWATANCQNFCGLCNQRKKRDAGDDLLSPPPLKNENVKPFLNQEDLLTNELLAIENDVNLSGVNILDNIAVEEGELEEPAQPLCNTVRTEPSGHIDLIGKLLPGTVCEQAIVLSSESRVLLRFSDLDIDCDAGDELVVRDVVGDVEVPLCNAVDLTQWLSRGNIVLVTFIPAIQGHGVMYTYDAFPQNQTVQACNQFMTNVAGELAPMMSPADALSPDLACQIYITGTPGKRVQITFDDFSMTYQGQESCLHIKDVDLGEEDTYCGELSPFIWESSGSIVRITHEHGDFKASYVINDI